MKLPKLPPLAEMRKALINVGGLLTSLLALGLLPEPEAGWVASAAALVAVVTHFAVPNATPAIPLDGAALAKSTVDVAALKGYVTALTAHIDTLAEKAALKSASPPPDAVPPTDTQIKP